jgi:hypothetical protein
LPGGLGHPEVDHLRHRLIVVERDQYVARLEVAVDDSFLVGVLDGVADLEEQPQPPRDWQAPLVAVAGDGHPADQFHHEIGTAAVGGARLPHLCDFGVVHHRQRLPLGLEAGNDLAAVHARLDDLDRHLPPHGLRLLGHEHDAHAPLADLL